VSEEHAAERPHHEGDAGGERGDGTRRPVRVGAEEPVEDEGGGPMGAVPDRFGTPRAAGPAVSAVARGPVRPAARAGARGATPEGAANAAPAYAEHPGAPGSWERIELRLRTSITAAIDGKMLFRGPAVLMCSH
jgi:hypothetical protein